MGRMEQNYRWVKNVYFMEHDSHVTKHKLNNKRMVLPKENNLMISFHLI